MKRIDKRRVLFDIRVCFHKRFIYVVIHEAQFHFGCQPPPHESL